LIYNFYWLKNYVFCVTDDILLMPSYVKFVFVDAIAKLIAKIRSSNFYHCTIARVAKLKQWVRLEESV